MEQTLPKPIGKGQITIPWSWRKVLWINGNTYIKATLTSDWVFIQNAHINFDEINDEKNFDEAVKTDVIKSKLSVLASKL